MEAFLKTAITRYRQRRDQTASNAGQPMARRIEQAAQDIVAVIERRLDRKKDDGRPLFVVLGEVHNVPAHLLLGHRLWRILQQRGYSIAMGIEEGHDIAHRSLYALHAQQTPWAKLRLWHRLLNRADMDDPVHVALNTSNYNDAPVSRLFCDNARIVNGVSMAFNDASQYQGILPTGIGSALRQSDPVFQRVLLRDKKSLPRRQISSTETLGMFLRNRIMVARAQEHAEARKPQIYIQQCGGAHVAGTSAIWGPGHATPYAHSLTAIFNAQGHDVLGVPVCMPGYERLDMPLSTHWNRMIRPVALRGPRFEISSRFSSHREERAWLRSVLVHLEPGVRLDGLLRPRDRVYAEHVGGHYADALCTLRRGV